MWKELNKAIVDEPFLPKKYVTPLKMDWTITPELLLVMNEKEEELEEALGDEADESKDHVVDVPKDEEEESDDVLVDAGNGLSTDKEDVKLLDQESTL